MDFRAFEDEFLALTTEIVYCTVTTVDARCRPRSRLMHPIFEVMNNHPGGWAVTDRTPIKTRHLAANPHIACFYWSPAQNTVAIDCIATWVADTAVKHYVWDLFASPTPPGWGDMSGYGPAGIDHPQFNVLRLVPWRVQIVRAQDMAAGQFTPRVWQRAETGSGRVELDG